MNMPTFCAMIARMSEEQRRDRANAEITRALSLMQLAKRRVQQLRSRGPKFARRCDAIVDACQTVEVLREQMLVSGQRLANLERLFELQNATALLEIRCARDESAPRAAPVGVAVVASEPEVIDLTGDDDLPRPAPRVVEVIDLSQDE